MIENVTMMCQRIVLTKQAEDAKKLPNFCVVKILRQTYLHKIFKPILYFGSALQMTQ